MPRRGEVSTLLQLPCGLDLDRDVLTRQRSLKDCEENRAVSGFGLSRKRSFSSTDELKLT